MPTRILIVCFLSTCMLLRAEPRAWRSADGGKSIQGIFVKRDETSVTIRRSNQREVSIPLEKIHRDDRAWLDARHPLPVVEPAPAAQVVFDTLEFGDSRARVMEKLKASKLVKATLPETLFARTGLNGIFQTRQKIGGLETSLYFDWCGDGGLKELTLQTTPLSGEEAETRLTPCWKELIDLLTILHGKPINANGKLDLTGIANGSMSATHLWKLEHRGTAMLGAARDGDAWQIAVRFTTEDVKPVIIPATHGP
ncbi:MAG: hypothetical protein MUF86_03250 [Akkermansiaceae bacterium]|jgi:hypothetical protein|nr:hypothetical protein [Akkermansiaceae bacterium]MCU0776665.1 hypothetical protein [Akkermansiaceae bacterium]